MKNKAQIHVFHGSHCPAEPHLPFQTYYIPLNPLHPGLQLYHTRILSELPFQILDLRKIKLAGRHWIPGPS